MITNSAFDLVDSRRDQREIIDIRCDTDTWSIDADDITAPGIDLDEAVSQRQAFADALLQIGAVVRGQASRAQLANTLPSSPQALIEMLGPALRLPATGIYGEMLENCRLDLLRAGKALYGSLTMEMKQDLARFGLWSTNQDKGEDPALFFLLDAKSIQQQAPVCWNMIYQNEKPIPKFDWHRFWGFRIPIAQWLRKARKSQIPVRSALIAADTRLGYAQVEQEVVGSFVTGHELISNRLQRYAGESLSDYCPPDSTVTAAWLEQHRHEQNWLAAFLQEVFEKQAKTKGREWKTNALTKIFTEDAIYDLIHFACHCHPPVKTYGSRRLELLAGGETIEIDSTLMTGSLKRRDDLRAWGPKDDGPIVFLNACTSATQGDSVKADRFPELPCDWIECQGATAIVATICDVPDIFACAFAARFYQTLFDALVEFRQRNDAYRERLQDNPTLREPAPPAPRNLYLAEALLEARKYFLDQFNNPLGLAYELYAYRGARLDLVGGVGGEDGN